MTLANTRKAFAVSAYFFFLAADFFTTAFFTAVFLTAVFLTAVFLTVAALGAAFFGALFLAAAFFVAAFAGAFFLADFFPPKALSQFSQNCGVVPVRTIGPLITEFRLSDLTCDGS